MSPAIHSSQIALLSTQNRLPSAAQALIFAAVVVTKWDMHRQTRKSLTKLDAQQLKDIGITQMTADFETQKPFWRS